MTATICAEADDLPTDQYDYSTVRDLEFADVEMPEDFEPEIHIVHPDGETTLCDDPVGCRRESEFEAEQFEDRDYDARDWLEARDDACEHCEDVFLSATEGEE